MPFIESFGGQALLSGISTAMNWLQQGHSISAQKDAQKELMNHQFELNKQQWNAENEYNSPGAQMQRLKNAGLNPNLVYGSGAVTGNTTTQGPRAQFTHVDRNQARFENLAQIAERVQSLKSMRANASAQEALANLYGQKAATEQLTRNAMKLDIVKKEFDNYILGQTYQNSIEGSKLALENLRHDIMVKGKQLGIQDKQIEKLASEIGLIASNKANVEERTKTQRYQNEYWWQYGQNPSGSIGKAIFDFITGLLKGAGADDSTYKPSKSFQNSVDRSLDAENLRKNGGSFMDYILNALMHFDENDPRTGWK